MDLKTIIKEILMLVMLMMFWQVMNVRTGDIESDFNVLNNNNEFTSSSIFFDGPSQGLLSIFVK